MDSCQLEKTVISRPITKTLLLVGSLLVASAPMAATLPFASTSESSAWKVATNVGGVDGQFSSFNTTDFQDAVATTLNRAGWIANNASGTNGSMGTWTFFDFRQTFDLTGYDPSTAVLKFQWAADDSGEGYDFRGTWVPKFSLNGGGLIPWGSGPTYSLGSEVTLDSGFVTGQNRIDFFVEGNGVTDGFQLVSVSLTAQPVPEPEVYSMLLAGLGLFGVIARRKKLA